MTPEKVLRWGLIRVETPTNENLQTFVARFPPPLLTKAHCFTQDILRGSPA